MSDPRLRRAVIIRANARLDAIRTKGGVDHAEPQDLDAAPARSQETETVICHGNAAQEGVMMKYNVLEDFELPGGKTEPVKVASGTVWIPVETGVPKYEVERLVHEGKIALIVPNEAADGGNKRSRRGRSD